MKKLMMMVLMTMMVVVANAKGNSVTLVSGNGDILLDSKKTATITFDYSKTMVEGKHIDTFLKDRGDNFVKDWPAIAKVGLDQFIKSFNSKNKKGVQIIEKGGADLKMVMNVADLYFGNAAKAAILGGLPGSNGGGAIISGRLIITDAKSGEKVAEYDILKVYGIGATDFSESKRLAHCYDSVVRKILKASK